MIKGINQVTLAVLDLDQAFAFYSEVLQLTPLAERKNKSAYFLAGENWITLVLDKNLSRDRTSYSHLAFSVSQSDFPAASERIKRSGAEIWQVNSSPGDSLYFTDPTGNRLEIHASDWNGRMAWLKANPSSEVEIFNDGSS